MQDAHVRNVSRELPPQAETLESLRELNRHFLDLVAMRSDDWDSSKRVGLPREVSGRIAPLSHAQKKAVANCPYALFDLRFADEDHWCARLAGEREWNVSDSVSADENTLQFVNLALFFAWHVASTGTLAAGLLLGMSEPICTLFRSATIDCLPGLAATEAANLTARWSHSSIFWSALMNAGARTNLAALRRIQLSGLQFAAAARLPSD